MSLVTLLALGCSGPIGGTADRDPTSSGASAGSGSPAGGSGGGSAGSSSSSAGTPASGGNSSSAGSSSSAGTTSLGGTSSGGSSTVQLPNEFCAGLSYEENVTIASSQTDRFLWNDADCQPRTTSLARQPRGYARQYSYMVDGNLRTATGTGVNGHMGWGFPVNHGLSGLSGGGPLGSGEFHAIFVGTHHAIYEYKLVNNNITVTLHWFFASGRNHPVVAINYDLTQTSPGLKGDTRTPYGDIQFDGDENFGKTVISGIGWGDRYKFKTTQAPLTRNSTWDYTEQNLVPYVLEWVDASDAEMGAVQSQTYLQKDAGGYWLYKNWGKTSANQARDDGQVGNMPVSWNWPYQMNQYELCYPESEGCVNQTTGSHRLAWGANYGAVGGVDGSGMYPNYGDDKQLDGYPYQSYSVFMVMGKHSSDTVLGQVREIEIVQKTSLAATVGSVVTSLPLGIGRPDTGTLQPAGYDPRYSTWNVTAAENKVAFGISVAEGALRNPVLVVSNFTGATVPGVSLDGTALEADVDYLATLDSANQKLWITLRHAFEGTHQIAIE